MNDSAPLSNELTVAELLARCSRTAQVFIRFRMACVGCPMCGFETLEAAASNYGLPSALLLEELERVIRTPAGDDELSS